MNTESMSLDPKSRARKFITSAISKMQVEKTSSLQNIDILITTLMQYAEASSDYVAARLQYLDILNKYQSASNSAVFQSFPGVSSYLPTYPTEEMAKDTADMKQLATLIKDLSNQLEALEEELLRASKQAAASIPGMIESLNKTTAYCDQLLTAIDSPYDAGLLTPNGEA